jgi:hypothetical protein
MSFNELHSADKFNEAYINGFFLPQQEPFYFQKPVPSTVKLRGKIDLSFFRNQPIVSQYRFKLVIPEGGETAIERNLNNWSAWISFNFIEIIIPLLDREGGYKLLIEYKTAKTSEISKFEKPFYVYRNNAMAGAVVAGSTASLPVDKPAAKVDPVTEKAATKAAPATDKPTAKPAVITNNPTIETTPATKPPTTKTIPAAEKVSVEKVEISNNEIVLASIETKEDNTSNTSTQTENKTNEPLAEPEVVKEPDYDMLLGEAIEKKDTVLFRKSVQNGAGDGIKGADGGNIFHLIDNTFADQENVSLLTKNGIPINETDNYGNSPLHAAILSGNSEYARILINQGVDLNIKNILELSPLHVAAFLDNKEVVNQMLTKGAEIDMKGNSGYTPLHIATEMNHIALVKDLLSMGANCRIKTGQKLTPKAIAKIQGNDEMIKLISKKGSYTVNLPKPVSTNSTTILNSPKLNPKYDFKLPYDQELAKKRHSNKVIQALSLPIFIISTAGLTYFKSEANSYYSLYKTAETEQMAKDLYNKANKYDTYSYISGGISLASIYGFIHSTIRKKNISYEMRKRFN